MVEKLLAGYIITSSPKFLFFFSCFPSLERVMKQTSWVDGRG